MKQKVLQLLILVLWLLAGMATAAAQTVRHTDKTEIKPPGAPADAVSIWGGLRAGPNGAIQVINADGSLSVSATVTDGSLTFAKWASNGCGSGDVPVFDGSLWGCGAGGGGGAGLTAGSNSTITGNWRFSTATVFGDTTTPQQLVHLYKSGAQAALRLEHGGSGYWDVTASGTNLLFGTSTGTKVTFTPTGLGIGKTPGTALDVAGTATVTGLAVNGSIGSHLSPSSSDTYDLGSTGALWGQAFVSQLNAVTFAESTATLFGGHSIIGKNAGTLAATAASAATTIDFGKAMTPGHWIVIRAHDSTGTIRTEYLQIGALAAGTTYNVTRDLGATSAPDPVWPKGTPFLVQGASGDGRIELAAYTTPRISILHQGAAYNTTTESVRLGYLDGMPGVASGKVGLYLGDTTTAGLSFYDATLLVRGTVQATSGYFGDSGNAVTVDASGLSVGTAGAIRTAGTTWASGSGFWFGYDGGTYKARIGSPTSYVRWDGTTFTIAGDGSGLTAIQGGNIATGTIGASAIAADSISSTHIASNTIVAGDIAAGAITTSRLLVKSGGASLTPDPDFLDLSAWLLNTGGTAEGSSIYSLVNLADGVSGQSALRVQPSTTTWLYSQPSAYQATKGYAMRLSVRASGTANGVLYATLIGIACNGTITYTPWALLANGVTPSTSWTSYSGVLPTNYAWGGTAPCFIAAAVAANFNATLGYHDVQGVHLEERAPSVLIEDGAITADKITASAITTTKLAADAVTSAKIAAGTIEASDIAVGTITADRIAAGTITTTQLQAGSITGDRLAAGSVTADKLSVGSLSAISADLGTVTAGTLNAVTINSGTLNTATIGTGGMTVGSSIVVNANTYLNDDLYMNPSGTEETASSNAYPLVWSLSGVDPGRVRPKNNGAHGLYCGGGSPVSELNIERGIVVGVTCGPAPDVEALRNEIAELKALVAQLMSR